MKRLKISLLTLVTLLAPLTAWAERPTSMRMFPGRAVFFLRTPDAVEFAERWQNGGGRALMRDEEISRFLRVLGAKVDASFRESPPGKVFGSLSNVFALFRGEVAFAVVPRRNEFAGFIFMADTVSAADRDAGDTLAMTEGLDRAHRMIESIKAVAEESGALVKPQQIGSVEVTVIREGGDQHDAFGIFERDGVLLASNDPILLETAIAKWDEAEGLPTLQPEDVVDDPDARVEDESRAKRAKRLRQRYAAPLADNEAFTESLRECVEERIGGGDASPPQMVMFLDPVGIFRAMAQENAGMRIALATLPVLGLDGFQGIGSAMWMDEGDWASLFRAHILLDNPRSGILKMVRLAPADTTPSDAIPADVAAYSCGAINFLSVLDGAGQLVNRIRGEGEFEKGLQDIETGLGISAREFLDHLDGRFVSVQAYGATPEGAPPRVNPARLVFLRTTDPEWMMAKVKQLLDRAGVKNVEARSYKDVEYLVLTDEEARMLRQQEEGPTPGQPPVPLTCIAMIDDDLVLSETPALLHHALDARAGDADRLADSLPFRLTASRVQRLGQGSIGADEGRLITYQDPGAQFRAWGAAGSSETSLQQLEQMGQFFPPMRWLRETIDEAGVPSVETLSKFAVPSGGALYDTPRGFRYVAFGFRMQEEDE